MIVPSLDLFFVLNPVVILSIVWNMYMVVLVSVHSSGFPTRCAGFL